MIRCIVVVGVFVVIMMMFGMNLLYVEGSFFVFGDSLIDNGWLEWEFFFGVFLVVLGYVDGCFINGLVWVEYLVSLMVFGVDLM